MGVKDQMDTTEEVVGWERGILDAESAAGLKMQRGMKVLQK